MRYGILGTQILLALGPFFITNKSVFPLNWSFFTFQLSIIFSLIYRKAFSFKPLYGNDVYTQKSHEYVFAFEFCFPTSAACYLSKYKRNVTSASKRI